MTYPAHILAALALLIWWGATLAVQSVLRVVTDGGIFPWLFALLLLVTVGAARRLTAQPFGLPLFGISSLYLLVFVISVWWFSGHWDLEWDAQAYHLPAIVSLMDGWNPVYEQHPLLWANYYPNGWWSLQASMVSLMQPLGASFESGRALTLLLLGAAISLIYTVIKLCIPSRIICFLITLVALCNPVVITQLTTHMVDGVMSMLALCMVATLTLALHTKAPLYYLACAAAIMLLINTKMSGVYWGATGCAIVLICYAMVQRRLPIKPAMVCMVAALFALVVVGFKPFVTNVRDQGMLVYPPIDTHLPNHYPEGVAGLSQPERLIYLLSTQSADSQERYFPWQLSMADWQHMPEYHLWREHFSAWFGLICLLSVIIAVTATLLKPANNVVVWTTSLLLLGSLLLFPENWHVRFVPFLWLLPVILSLNVSTHKRFQYSVVLFILLPMIIIGGYRLYGSSHHAIYESHAMQHYIDSISQPIGITRPAEEKEAKIFSYHTWEQRFKQQGITYDVLDIHQCLSLYDHEFTSRTLAGIRLCY